jgi:predicted PurR-regulated permease PerM
MWAALSALFVVFLASVGIGFIWVMAKAIGQLQPILIPVAIAGILAYLLDPVVTRMCRGGMSRSRAVILLFLVVSLVLVLIGTLVVPAISEQSANFARDLPGYTQKARDEVVDILYRYNRTFGPGHGKSTSSTANVLGWLLGTSPHAIPTPTPAPTPAPEPSVVAESIGPAPAKLTNADREHIQDFVKKQIPNLERQLPAWTEKVWTIIKTSIGGFLGFTGFLLSLILVPIYLFFFLKERPQIEKRWKEYLPLRASPLKDEVAEVILQINSYIIAYFRGQLYVCLLDGLLIGSTLALLLGLNFAPLIGLLVAILTMIPYIGIVVCWIPAVLIAAFQFGDFMHPLWVTIIFIVVQNLEGMFYAPRIVGKSVGLHPMTVIVSIFVWGLLIGGLLGPILAVPLTATVKVLMARYVWGRRLREEVMHSVEKVPVVAAADAAGA